MAEKDAKLYRIGAPSPLASPARDMVRDERPKYDRPDERMSELHFLYHELRPAASAYTYVVPCSAFEAHCAFFAANGERERFYRPAITFDDGHASDLEFAAPILARFGLKARFFITAGWTGVKSGYLSRSDLRELAAEGHTIGAHGMTHKLLTQCSARELDEELRGARQQIEDCIAAPVTTMSLPGGRYNRKVLQACRDAGYEQVFTSLPAVAEMESHPATVGRINLQGSTTVEWLGRVLDPSSGLLTRLGRSDRAKSLAKQLLGDRAYARLWALGNSHSANTTAEQESSAS